MLSLGLNCLMYMCCKMLSFMYFMFLWLELGSNAITISKWIFFTNNCFVLKWNRWLLYVRWWNFRKRSSYYSWWHCSFGCYAAFHLIVLFIYSRLLRKLLNGMWKMPKTVITPDYRVQRYQRSSFLRLKAFPRLCFLCFQMGFLWEQLIFSALFDRFC